MSVQYSSMCLTYLHDRQPEGPRTNTKPRPASDIWEQLPLDRVALSEPAVGQGGCWLSGRGCTLSEPRRRGRSERCLLLEKSRTFCGECRLRLGSTSRTYLWCRRNSFWCQPQNLKWSFLLSLVFTFFTVWIGPTFNSQLIYLEFKDTFYAKKDLEVIFRLSKSKYK